MRAPNCTCPAYEAIRPGSGSGAAVALKVLVDRRDSLGRARTEVLNRLHQLLLELIAGGAKQCLSAPQTRALPQHRPAPQHRGPMTAGMDQATARAKLLQILPIAAAALGGA